MGLLVGFLVGPQVGVAENISMPQMGSMDGPVLPTCCCCLFDARLRKHRATPRARARPDSRCASSAAHERDGQSERQTQGGREAERGSEGRAERARIVLWSPAAGHHHARKTIPSVAERVRFRRQGQRPAELTGSQVRQPKCSRCMAGQGTRASFAAPSPQLRPETSEQPRATDTGNKDGSNDH